jgi:hypothetical protein
VGRLTEGPALCSAFRGVAPGVSKGLAGVSSRVRARGALPGGSHLDTPAPLCSAFRGWPPGVSKSSRRLSLVCARARRAVTCATCRNNRVSTRLFEDSVAVREPQAPPSAGGRGRLPDARTPTTRRRRARGADPDGRSRSPLGTTRRLDAARHTGRDTPRAMSLRRCFTVRPRAANTQRGRVVLPATTATRPDPRAGQRQPDRALHAAQLPRVDRDRPLPAAGSARV